ncbi:MAG TPA: hypothetical protein VFK54_01540 [Candidatus Limnocylindrales bacterium]|nr:hypothetical protein [Candidatus Limnocylindrales bacterium]
MDWSAAKRPTSGTLARLVAVALYVALAVLLTLGPPVLAADPNHGNGNGNGNGSGNGGGPDRTETPGNGNDRKPTPEPQTPEPTRAPTPAPTVAELPPATTAPAAPAEPAAPPAATAAAPIQTPVPVRATSRPAAPTTSGQTAPAPAPRSGGTGADGDVPASPARPAASPRAARPPVPLDDVQGTGGSMVGSITPHGDAPVVPALVVLVAFASTAGGMVLVGRRRGVPAAEPAVVPTGLTPFQDVAPASDPLLAALQGSARFAPPDGTTTAASRVTHGDGAPLWVRRLEPRIPVLAGTMSPPPRRGQPQPELEDALGS